MSAGQRSCVRCSSTWFIFLDWSDGERNTRVRLCRGPCLPIFLPNIYLERCFPQRFTFLAEGHRLSRFERTVIVTGCGHGKERFSRLKGIIRKSLWEKTWEMKRRAAAISCHYDSTRRPSGGGDCFACSGICRNCRFFPRQRVCPRGLKIRINGQVRSVRRGRVGNGGRGVNPGWVFGPDIAFISGWTLKGGKNYCYKIWYICSFSFSSLKIIIQKIILSLKFY